MGEEPNYYAILPAVVRYDKDLKASEKLLYAEITALAGKEGSCWATNGYFAELFDCVEETISRAISKLEKKKYIQREIIYKQGTKEIEKRLLYPLTKLSIPIDEKINTPIDQKVKENNTSINNKEIYKESFDAWWNEYPRKISKGAAYKKYNSLLAEKKTTIDELLKGARKYATYCKENKTEPNYIKHPATWLNQECWCDEYASSYDDKYKLFG